MSNDSWTWSPQPNGSSGEPDGTVPVPTEPGSDASATPPAAPRHGYGTGAYAAPPSSSATDGYGAYAPPPSSDGYGPPPSLGSSDGAYGAPRSFGSSDGASGAPISRFGTPLTPGSARPGAHEQFGSPMSPPPFGSPQPPAAGPFGPPPAAPAAQFGPPAASQFGSPASPPAAQFGSAASPPAAPFGAPQPPYETTFGVSTTQSGQVMWPLEPAPRRRRRGLWIGVAAGVLVLLGLGGGWALFGSKLLAPASPTAAVNRFVDGLQHKDGLALLGSVSPAEVQPFRQMAADMKKDSTATPDPAAAKAMLDAFNALSITVDGLQTTEETLDEGLAKVTFTAGTLTIDGDPQKIADAVVAATANNPVLSGGGDTEGLRQEVIDSLTGKLPYTVDIATDWAANGEAPYLVAVHEGHGWYISPLMTLGEYGTASEGVQRGAMPKAENIARPASPADAAKQLASAIPALVGGDSGPLVSVLPEAERRFVAVYLQPAIDDGASATDAPQLTLTASDFDVADQTAERASVVPTNLAYTLVANGASGSFTYDGDCFTSAAAGTPGERVCFSEYPLASELGLDHLALTTVHEDGGWYVSFVSTFAEWSRIAGENFQRLQAEGKLDDDSFWQKMFPEASTAFAGSASDAEKSAVGDVMAGLESECVDGDQASCHQLCDAGGVFDQYALLGGAMPDERQLLCQAPPGGDQQAPSSRG